MKTGFPEGFQIVDLLVPKSDAAGRATSLFPSLKNALHAWIVCYIDQGAANTVDLIPYQAKTVANSPDLDKILANVVPIYSNLDMAAGSKFTRETSATHYVTDAGVKHKCVIFDIDLNALDANGGFDCIGITTGASAAGNITSALLIVLPKYQGDDGVDFTID